MCVTSDQSPGPLSPARRARTRSSRRATSSPSWNGIFEEAAPRALLPGMDVRALASGDGRILTSYPSLAMPRPCRVFSGGVANPPHLISCDTNGNLTSRLQPSVQNLYYNSDVG